METDKTGLCQLIEWWDNKNTFRMRQYSGIEVIDNARALLADEKSAMEKAQGKISCDNCDSTGSMRGMTDEHGNCVTCPICYGKGTVDPKPINPVVAAHNEALGPLRLALWEMLDEYEANIKDSAIYSTDAKDLMSSLKAVLEKNPPEQKPPAPAIDNVDNKKG